MGKALKGSAVKEGKRGKGGRVKVIQYILEEMIKKQNKGRLVLAQKQDSSPYALIRDTLPSAKTASFKVDLLGLSRITHNENRPQMVFTPRAKGYNDRQFLQEAVSKSINTTPTKQRPRKEHSFILPSNSRKEDLPPPSPTPKPTLRETFTNRSQHILKTKPLNNDSSTRRIDQMAKLRQTVTNATSWQYRTTAPSSTTLKPPPEQQKKNQLEYMEIKKELKSKFASKQHSRNNSRTQDLFYVQNIPINERPPTRKTPTKATPRVSQDKLTSGNGNKDRSMSKIEPISGFTSLSLNKKQTSIRPSELRIQDFSLGSCKGEGRFGKVFPAVHKKTGFLMAIKQVSKESVRLMLDQFVQQIKINLFLNHPNIVRVYGCFSDKDNVYIMMEYMEEGSLYRLCKLSKKFSQQETGTKLTEICQAVKYLHGQDILHRDIKPQNIVLSNGVCKLCDFGWATYSKQRRTTYCGTLDYVCPEILQGQSYDNFVDIWAIGVLAYEMLVGKAPFYHISRKQTMKSIMNCDFTFPADISVSAKLFIKKALQKNPDNRFTVDSLLRDRFLLQIASQ